MNKIMKTIELLKEGCGIGFEWLSAMMPFILLTIIAWLLFAYVVRNNRSLRKKIYKTFGI